MNKDLENSFIEESISILKKCQTPKIYFMYIFFNVCRAEDIAPVEILLMYVATCMFQDV